MANRYLRKTGDWSKMNNVVHFLEKECKDAREKSLKRFGLEMENLTTGHIQNQDLGWPALNPKTVSEKVRKGYSENILVRTSTYFQAITSWVSDDTSYTGVKRDVENADGTEVHKIAAIHEFGSTTANIPARPLWTPSFAEALEWHYKHNTPEMHLNKALKKYL